MHVETPVLRSSKGHLCCECSASQGHDLIQNIGQISGEKRVRVDQEIGLVSDVEVRENERPVGLCRNGHVDRGHGVPITIGGSLPG